MAHIARSVVCLLLGLSLLGSAAEAQGLLAGVLPSSRSVRVGDPASAFATIINTGASTATACGLAPATVVPAAFLYQTTAFTTNLPIGTPNTPVDILPGGMQSYVFAFTPTAPFPPTDVAITFSCSNTAAAPVVVGLNTLLLTASADPVPDVVALSATIDGDGIVRAPSLAAGGNVGAFAVATVNVGVAGQIAVSGDFGAASLPAAVTVCETNPATAQCLGPPAPTVTRQILAQETSTFSIFVRFDGPVALDPAANRAFVRFTDAVAGGAVRGATSVALHAPAVAPATVTVGASGPTAAETGPTSGVFTVARTGDVSGPLVVFYSVAGTATPGADYLPLAGSVLLPAGASSAPVIVTPLVDGEVEEDETVVVTIRADSTYRIGAPSAATVTIAGERVHETRINAGGPAYTDAQGRVWAADTNFLDGATFATASAIAGTADDPLYQTERFGAAFSYRVPVPNGRYSVTLHFSENFVTGPGQRLFDVSLEGVKVLDHFDVFAAAGAANTAVARTFLADVNDGLVDLAFTGVAENAKIDAIEIIGQPAGHPFLHVVIQAPPYAVDYDGNGSEPVSLDGSASHTHEPGRTLASFAWTVGGTTLGATPIVTAGLALGRHEVVLTIGDDDAPPKTLAGTAVVDVYPITAVGGVLATYHPGGSIDAPGSAAFTEVRPTLRVDAIADRIGGSPFSGNVAIVLAGRLAVAAPATYAFQLSGGVASQLLVDGVPVTGPLPLGAGPHAIEARFAVGTFAQLPVQVLASIDGAPAAPLAAASVTHDETSLPPFINALSLTSGSEIGGEPVTIEGLGFFTKGSGTVTVNWGGLVIETALISVTPSAITLVTPPGTGTIAVTVQAPNGVSNAVTFTYATGTLPISFTSSLIAGATPEWPTQAAWGPDGRLYVGSTTGVITIYTFGDAYEVLATQTVNTLANVPNKDILGIAFNPFDPPSPVKLYVGHGALFASNNGLCPTGPDPYSGQVSVLTGPGFDTITPVITGLPVSNHDHGINGMEFDHNGDLLVSVGGMTNGGVPTCNMGGLPESPLSGTILKARLSKGAAFSGAVSYTGAQPPLDNADQRAGHQVSVAPGADVEVFAAGFRNAFDLVLTTRGRIYATDNGPDVDFGPESTGPASQGQEAVDEDELNLIEIDDYYGHPNRNRGRTDSRQNIYRGNSAPADPANFISGLTILPSSINGIAEYRAQTFDGAMRGDLLTQQLHDETWRIRLSADGRSVVSSVPLGLDFDALDVLTGPGGVVLGTAFAEGRLRIARPNDPGPGARVYDIYPWRAPAGGGTPFVIGGRGFVPGQTTVAIGGTPAIVNSVSPTRIRGIIPPRPSPTADLLAVVVTVAGQPAALPAAFRYLFAPGQEDSGAQATVVIDPGGSLLDSSTFNPGSFQVVNESTRGQLIERVRVDLRSAIFRDLVFDPAGQAGDLASKPFTADSPPEQVGLAGAVVHFPHDGGFDAIDVRFGAFGPGKTFLFSIDADPSSIRGVGAPGPGESGSVSGLELTGARVTVYFSDGTMLAGQTFRVPGSLTGSRVALKGAGPSEAPGIQIQGLQTPATVTTPVQNVLVTGPPGATGSLLVVEGGLFTAGVPGGGFDLDPFEANTALAVSEVQFQIAGFGAVSVPVILTRTGGAETGLNHIVAVLKDGAARTGPLSSVLILKLQ